MKHLEELEKELQALLEEAIPDCSKPVIDLAVRKTPITYKSRRNNYLFNLLEGRKILQAYDVVEHRKFWLENHVFLIIYPEYPTERCYFSGRNIFGKSNISDKPHNLSEEQLSHIEKTVKKEISDYEWEWLSKQEGKDET